ncbi:MAG TPA: adenosylcobinamide-GDP ribazoletransferase [Candidatus Atribacteria bacterium]|nr:adenosylcobinamide-GDP ribazoletransferase [Candidatus Atribacteria bacterium]
MAAEIKKAGGEAIRRLKIALSFLTIFPVDSGEYREGDLSRASFFFPVVGTIIGALSALFFYLLYFLSGDSLLSAFGVAFLGIFITRGLHLDGLADSFDALFSGAPQDRKQEILKDPRHGTFGVVGILFLVGAKIFLLGGIEKDPLLFLFLAPIAGRAAALQWGAFFHPFPRQRKGLGEEFVGQVPSFYFFLWLVLVGMIGLKLGGVETLLKIALVFAIIYLLGRELNVIFGGLNGDIIGLGIELAEILILIGGRF